MDWPEIAAVTLALFILFSGSFAALRFAYREGVSRGAHEIRQEVRQAAAVEIAKFRRGDVTPIKPQPGAWPPPEA